jgi:hypothetical protein
MTKTPQPSPIDKAESIIEAIRSGKPLDRTAVRECLEQLVEAVRLP